MNPKHYLKKFKKKDAKSKSSYISNLFTRFLVSIIVLLGGVIFIKYSDKNLLNFKTHVFNKSFSFVKVNKLYQKYLGNLLPLDNNILKTEESVFNEVLEFENSSTYLDGAKLTVADNYLVPIISSGIVVFMGEKEDYGYTVIIQGIDGYDIWYGNIANCNLKLYDYVEKGVLLGEAKDNMIYLVVQKDGTKVDYETYIQI